MTTSKRYYDETDDVIGYWDRRHAEWNEHPDWGVYPTKARWFDERFAHILPVPEVPWGRVLDWGCGNGMYSVPLLRRYVHYTGWDASYAAIRTARTYFSHRGGEREFMVRDLALRLEPCHWGRFDLVLSITVLQHQPLPKRLAMIDNIKLLLRPGGRYVGLEMMGATQAYDMPPMSIDDWRAAWQPLEIVFDRPAHNPRWADDNVWYTL